MKHATWAVAGLLLVLLGVWGGIQLAGLPFSIGGDQSPEKAFLEQFWEEPIPAQGPPPEDFTSLEASLGPEDCRSCHPRKFEQWEESLHSQTMGPGIWWQFRVKSPGEVKGCMRCHAPLAEQKALVAQNLNWETAPPEPPPDFIPDDLHRQGLACAACHVRNHRRFGPPAEDSLPTDRAPHGGFKAEDAFRDSQFCAECHQFPEDGPTLDGELRQNTHEEWRASEYAERGVSCQDCHMPQGDHTWRGVHDPGMVREAVTMGLESAPTGGDRIRVRGRVANTGAGHKLPTYTTPKLTARLLLVGPEGRVDRVVDTADIAWRADVKMSREIYDTRLDPGEAVELAGRVDRPAESGWEIHLRLDVAPRHHYERLFRYMFRQADTMDATTLESLEEALKEAQATRFRLEPLTRPVPAAEG